MADQGFPALNSDQKAMLSRVQGASQPTYDMAYRLANTLPYNYENLGYAYAQKYGNDALAQLLNGGLQSQTVPQMRQTTEQMDQAGREWDAMYDRERNRMRR